MQNAAVSVIIQLVEGIDPAKQRHPLQRTIAGYDFGRQLLAWFQIALQPADRHRFIALQSDRLPRRTFLESQRQNARSEEHTSELQSRRDLVCRLLLEKKKKK